MNKLYYFISLLFCTAMFCTFSYGQSCDDYLMTTYKMDDEIILVSTQNSILTLEKIDLEGTLQWTYDDTIQSFEPISRAKIYDFDEDTFYLTIITFSYTEFWKLDKATGNLIWKTSLFDSDSDISTDLFKLNANTLLFSLSTPNSSGGSAAGIQLHTLDIATGINTLYQEFDYSFNTFRMSQDSFGSFIVTSAGLTYQNEYTGFTVIKKFNSYNFKNVIWEQSYPDTGMASIERDRNLFIDKYNNIYVFENYEGGTDLLKLNGQNGEILWSIDNIDNAAAVSQFMIVENSIYVSLRHVYVGAGNPYMRMIRINAQTGEYIFNSFIDITVDGEILPGTESGVSDEDAILGFDVDCNGDVYATGYYADANYGPGAWGILKIDGNTGENLIDETVTIENQYIDTHSSGTISYVVEDGVIFIGNMQYSLQKNTRAFIKTDVDLNMSQPAIYYCLGDTDGDGIPDIAEDADNAGYVDNDDTDGDGIPNFEDPDDDGDTVQTIDEILGIGAGLIPSPVYTFIDTDNDLIENYLDFDDDNDTVLTKNEDYDNNGTAINDDMNNNTIPDFLEFEVSIGAIVANQPIELQLCDANNSGDEIEIFDLTTSIPQIIGNQTNVTVTFYTTNTNAQQDIDQIESPETYNNLVNPQTLFARVTDNTNGNFAVTIQDLLVLSQFVPAALPEDVFVEENDNDGTAIFDLTVNELIMLGAQNPSSVVFKYFVTQEDATNYTNPIANPDTYSNLSNPQQIFVTVENTTGGCITQTNFEIRTTDILDIPENYKDNFTIYPNPTNGKLQIIYNEQVEINSVQVISVNGKILKNIVPKGNEISIASLASGLYFIKINSNSLIQTIKVVKQ